MMNETSETLRELLATHRANVRDLVKEKAIGFDTTLNRKLERERSEIVEIKEKLHSLGIGVEDDPLDGQGKPSVRLQQGRSEPNPQKPTAQTSETRTSATHPAWILLLFAVALSLSAVVMMQLRDIAATLIVFVFVLITLGIVLPFIGLQNKDLSQALWLRSYIATLQKVPGLGEILKIQGGQSTDPSQKNKD